MANFWFEIYGTETYHVHPNDERGFTDWGITLPSSKEAYDKFQVDRKGEHVFCKTEKENLQRVDEIICEFMGDPAPYIDYDSRFYRSLHELAFSALYNLGGSYVEEKHIQYIIDTWTTVYSSEEARTSDKLTEVDINRFIGLVRWALTDKWRFHATG